MDSIDQYCKYMHNSKWRKFFKTVFVQIFRIFAKIFRNLQRCEIYIKLQKLRHDDTTPN